MSKMASLCCSNWVKMKRSWMCTKVFKFGGLLKIMLQVNLPFLSTQAPMIKGNRRFKLDSILTKGLTVLSLSRTLNSSLFYFPRSYTLLFHGKHRKFILETYLPYVLEEGEAIAAKKRRRKLFTNAGGSEDDEMWNHIEFKHPARFETLAMEESKKQMILDDLEWFKSSKDYYAQIGKPWKRGYLLYGPPGTGKSTLVAAMANLLNYDIYDLELTSVKKNMQLRRLLTETKSKSIILIEDIDCSLELTGQRKSKAQENEDEKDPLKAKLLKEKDEDEKKSEVTLSGLLNFIDGIWSACGEERIIVFTTNHVDKLDPALVRSGRMDVHIELSYCRYDAFKVLAKNYLRLESHPLFDTIKNLLEETNVTPADVAENLMPRSLKATSVESVLSNLIAFIEKAKQENKIKCEEEVVLEGGEGPSLVVVE